MDPNLANVVVAVISFLTLIVTTYATIKLRQTHNLVNSQSEKLNAAIEGRALAVGREEGRAEEAAKGDTGDLAKGVAKGLLGVAEGLKDVAGEVKGAVRGATKDKR